MTTQGPAESAAAAPHPLDGCDPGECYQIMMAERTALITARQESENSLVKTIVQISSVLIAVMAGFITKIDVQISDRNFNLFAATLTVFGLAIVGGLAEHYYASKAYEEQQKLVEDFYQKEISTFSAAPSNKAVRRCQVTAFACFVIALFLLSAFALAAAGDDNDQRKVAPSVSAASKAPAFAVTNR